MEPGYQGPISNDPVDENSSNKHSALSGDDLAPGMDSIDPQADKMLKKRIENKLWGHTEVNVNGVNIFVKNGFVSLTGNVDGPEGRALIEGLVWTVDGVQDVVNFLEIHEQDD